MLRLQLCRVLSDGGLLTLALGAPARLFHILLFLRPPRHTLAVCVWWGGLGAGGTPEGALLHTVIHLSRCAADITAVCFGFTFPPLPTAAPVDAHQEG